MIRFFQNIRKQLAAENKVTSYLRYAIGEIVLVVVGILIALSINNWNEQRKTENRIVEILKEVQNDLGKNIMEADKTIEYYKYRKSRILQILNNKLTFDYYKTHPFSKFFLVGSRHIKLYDNGYKNLMQNANSIPDKYKIIINPLHELYIYDKYEIDKFDAGITQIASDYWATVSKFDWWYSEATSPTISDQMINYLLTPGYKNQAYLYGAAGWVTLSSNLSRFRYNAVDDYLQIAKLIGNEDEVPEFIDHNFVKIDSANLKRYTGTYSLITDDNKNNSTSETKFEISLKENHLVYTSSADTESDTDIYFRSTDEGYDKNGNKYKFTISKDSTVSGCVKGGYFTLISGQDIHYAKTK